MTIGEKAWTVLITGTLALLMFDVMLALCLWWTHE